MTLSLSRLLFIEDSVRLFKELGCKPGLTKLTFSSVSYFGLTLERRCHSSGDSYPAYISFTYFRTIYYEMQAFRLNKFSIQLFIVELLISFLPHLVPFGASQPPLLDGAQFVGLQHLEEKRGGLYTSRNAIQFILHASIHAFNMHALEVKCGIFAKAK